MRAKSAQQSAAWSGRPQLLVRHRTAERKARSAKPGQTVCRWSRKNPNSKGGKNPPSPPMAPTRPVTVPTSFGKYCGTSLKTAPLPMPSKNAQPSAPTVNGNIAGHDINRANGIIPRKTVWRTRAPPILSDSQPPSGRVRVASTTKPAVRKPASAGLNPNWSLSKTGRYIENATNPPKVRK